ncbi:hypothetical protein [Actinokineospora sp. NBRC 105648]|uniref:hypothetical protein n=1 Tax=Actinokineospora sp. NBRC 105648 TaxID=3032206 RepID=UPI0024A10151|nr:hypothetical protein [Actinokineospora sp. NBRC 105648]GLZ38653.1 hypothetical protein Acsp05_22770 [Actinokineospora sp. NBRC 105648]
MIRRVAVLPNPPLLVSELTGGDDPAAAELREKCLLVAHSLAAAASTWVVLGAGAEPAVLGPRVAGTFRGYGVDVRVALGDTADRDFADPALPLPALVAGLLREAAAAGDATVHVVPTDLPQAGCVEAGTALAESIVGPVGLLVLGDGSHRHGERSVGRPDDRAAGFDETVRRALATADLDALLGLDPVLAAELGAGGRAPWQVLAAAVRADGRTWRSTRAELVIPFGVAYHLAVWDPA